MAVGLAGPALCGDACGAPVCLDLAGLILRSALLADSFRERNAGLLKWNMRQLASEGICWLLVCALQCLYSAIS